jgi:hypothetical protein
MKTLKEKIKLLQDTDNKLNEIIQGEDFLNSDEKIRSFFEDIFLFNEMLIEVKKEFVQLDIFNLSESNLKSFLKEISSGKKFIADIAIETFGSNILDDIDIRSLDEDEVIQLASETLFSWFGPREYVEGLIEIGVLVTNATLPELLKSYIEEARKCYAFQQYNAVNALARIILEIAMRDICIRKGFIKKMDNNKDSYNKYRPWKLINKVASGKLKERIEILYYEKLSPTIHGFESFLDRDVKIELRNTIQMVEELYELNKIEI